MPVVTKRRLSGMNIGSSQGTEPDPGRVRGGVRVTLLLLSAIVVVLAVAAVFIPTFDGPNKRQHANEAAAVGRLRRTIQLQRGYAAAHPAEGFACQLARLKPKFAGGEYDPDEYLARTPYAGCVFSLENCVAGADGRVTNFQFIAVPLSPGLTDFRAFCTDERGNLWYDNAGSGKDACLSGMSCPAHNVVLCPSESA